MPDLAAGIDRNSAKQGGEPCIVGTPIPVRRIGYLVERKEYSPAEVAERYEISVSDAHRALAYYYDQRERDIESSADEATVETFDAACDCLRRDSN